MKLEKHFERLLKKFWYADDVLLALIDYIMLNVNKNDLRDDKLKFSEIEKKYNLSKATINRINQGKSYKIEGISYPIRTSKHRVR